MRIGRCALDQIEMSLRSLDGRLGCSVCSTPRLQIFTRPILSGVPLAVIDAVASGVSTFSSCDLAWCLPMGRLESP